MGKRIEKAAESYARHIKAQNPGEVIRAFQVGAKFANEGKWHFDKSEMPDIPIRESKQLVGLFLVAPMVFDIHMIEREDIPMLFEKDMLAWAYLSSLIPYNTFNDADRKRRSETKFQSPLQSGQGSV